MYSGMVCFVLLPEKPVRIYDSNVQQAFQTQNRWRDNSEIKVDALDRNIPTSTFIVRLSVCRMSRSFLLYSFYVYIYMYIYIYVRKLYTGCPRRNVRDFGRVFLRSNYTDITQNTYIQS
jgi:hypothetical protein